MHLSGLNSDLKHLLGGGANLSKIKQMKTLKNGRK